MRKKIYLDYAAATPLDPRVLKVMMPFFSSQFYNPSAIYLSARDVREKINESRHKIASLIGARQSEIIFTSGATEANNLALQGAARQFPKSEILVSAIEHESVLAPAELYKAKIIPADSKGLIKLNELSNLINNKTSLVSVMLVNNETGVVQPLSEIAKIVEDERKKRLKNSNDLPIYLHSDLAQAGNYLEINVSRMGLDMATINGGKIYGPKQSGILYVKSGIEVKPLIVGGGQEFGLRSGTENTANIVGFAAALDLAQNIRASEQKRITDLRMYFESEICKNFKTAFINGHAKHKAPHIVSVTFENIDNERLMMELDERGIECAVGSACSASSDEPSHVLKAMGLTDKQAQATMRFSLGRLTSKKDINRLIKTLKKLAV